MGLEGIAFNLKGLNVRPAISLKPRNNDVLPRAKGYKIQRVSMPYSLPEKPKYLEVPTVRTEDYPPSRKSGEASPSEYRLAA